MRYLNLLEVALPNTFYVAASPSRAGTGRTPMQKFPSSMKFPPRRFRGSAHDRTAPFLNGAGQRSDKGVVRVDIGIGSAQSARVDADEGCEERGNSLPVVSIGISELSDLGTNLLQRRVNGPCFAQYQAPFEATQAESRLLQGVGYAHFAIRILFATGASRGSCRRMRGFMNRFFNVFTRSRLIVRKICRSNLESSRSRSDRQHDRRTDRS